MIDAKATNKSYNQSDREPSETTRWSQGRP
jgi:hypothetical protein